MLSKSKLLQWVDDQIYVYAAPPEEGDSPEEVAMWKGEVQMLNKLKMHVSAGRLDAEEESPGPRFTMDAHGNLTPLEDHNEN